MDRLPPARAATRTPTQHHAARDLRALIAAVPIDEPVRETARAAL